MRIHTLGPQVTDSYTAAKFYNQHYCRNQAIICGHDSFENLLTHLKQYSKDYLLIPAAFKSNILKASWGDIHYALLEQMTLVTSFITQLDPLVVIQRQDANNRIGYTHAATAQLLSRIVHNIVIQTYPSKYRAYQAYCHDQAAFVLTNLKIVTLSSQEHIIKQLQPSMVWCLYQIN